MIGNIKQKYDITTYLHFTAEATNILTLIFFFEVGAL